MSEVISLSTLRLKLAEKEMIEKLAGHMDMLCRMCGF
ncbi:hypothetical protein PHO31112_04041 [Pandoraea horticolens]|uniref:Uncharacterized protein n=1 Tax=Pandoraea horticolens TaxID=2508298 RepID=A0A5E4XS67_9BURK|nr:hypothetical protein PHO31112_04041 [Pandoraea horticolens]